MDGESEMNNVEMNSEAHNDGDGANGDSAQIGPVNPGSRPDGDNFSKGNEDKKIFVGGISYETSNEDLISFFQQFGEVTQAQVKYDQMTGRSRGFAFVEFAASEPVCEVLKQRNREIKGKTVEVKPAKSRENKKIFVGGLPSDYPEEDLKAHFDTFGKVDDVEWPWDRARGLRRNFAFVVFEEESAADAASAENKQRFGDRMCDVKKAVPQPKRAMMGAEVGVGMRGGRGRGRGRGGYNQGYGGQWRGGYGGGWGGYGGGGWGDWYGSGSGGYGNYYGSGYGGGYYDDYYGSAGNDYYGSAYNWGGMGGGGGYDAYAQGQAGGAGGASGRGGRYQPY